MIKINKITCCNVRQLLKRINYLFCQLP